MKLKDRTGEVWERIVGDPLDAIWIVIGPSEDGVGHPCYTFDDGSFYTRGESTKSSDMSWENSGTLQRLA